MIDQKLELINRNFPIFPVFSEYMSANGKLDGLTIGWHCHLTHLTALVVPFMITAGARLHLSECNPDTTELDAVEFMRDAGATVNLGSGSEKVVADAQPVLVSDTGLVLISHLLGRHNTCFAASEITTSGITRLRAVEGVTFPVVNINDGVLKSLIENFHGVGDGVIDALFRLTGKMWAGRRAAVVGYGRVGAGVAAYLRKIGARVSVVEAEPVRSLAAHYDGFGISSLSQALAESELLITASGRDRLIGAAEWMQAADGLYVLNVGHWSSELDLDSLRQLASSQTPVNEFLKTYELPGSQGGKRIFVATEGSPVNVVMVSGSVEPTLIHLTTEMLCLNFLAEKLVSGLRLDPGEMRIPIEVENTAATLALQALNM